MIARLVPLLYCICPMAIGQELVQFELAPVPTTWSSRGDVGTGTGETLQGVHAAYHSGVGDTGVLCRIHGFTSRVQD